MSFGFGCRKSQHSLECILCSFHSSAYLVFPLALANSLGGMLNVRLEFASQCRRVQGLLWTPGWAVSFQVFILPVLKSPFLGSPSTLAAVTAGNWVLLSGMALPSPSEASLLQTRVFLPNIPGICLKFMRLAHLLLGYGKPRTPPNNSPFLLVLNTEENCQKQLSEPWQCADAVYIWLLEKWLYLSKARLPSLMLYTPEYFQFTQ